MFPIVRIFCLLGLKIPKVCFFFSSFFLSSDLVPMLSNYMSKWNVLFCLVGEYGESVDKTYYVFLPPELCLVHPLPGSLVRSAQRFPSIMRRVESMLLAVQLKHVINYPVPCSKVHQLSCFYFFFYFFFPTPKGWSSGKGNSWDLDSPWFDSPWTQQIGALWILVESYMNITVTK